MAIIYCISEVHEGLDQEERMEGKILEKRSAHSLSSLPIFSEIS